MSHLTEFPSWYDNWDCIADFLERMVEDKRLSIPNGTTEQALIERILEVLDIE